MAKKYVLMLCKPYISEETDYYVKITEHGFLKYRYQLRKSAEEGSLLTPLQANLHLFLFSLFPEQRKRRLFYYKKGKGTLCKQKLLS